MQFTVTFYKFMKLIGVFFAYMKFVETTQLSAEDESVKPLSHVSSVQLVFSNDAVASDILDVAAVGVDYADIGGLVYTKGFPFPELGLVSRANDAVTSVSKESSESNDAKRKVSQESMSHSSLCIFSESLVKCEISFCGCSDCSVCIYQRHQDGCH